MSKPEMFYALIRGEDMYESVADLFESVYGGYYAGSYPEDKDKSIDAVVEAWSVSDNKVHLPGAFWLTDAIIEYAEYVTEDWYIKASAAAEDPEVVAAFQEAIELFASKIHYWMADKVIARHRLTAGADGIPYLDREAVYGMG